RGGGVHAVPRPRLGGVRWRRSHDALAAVAESITEFPEAIQGVVQSRVSLRRVAEYLSADEIDCSRISHDSSGCRDDVMVSIEDLSITWATRSKADEPDANRKVLKKDNDEGTDSGASVSGPLLSNVNLKVERGDFVVVYGAVSNGGVRCERSPRHQARHLYGKLTTTEEPEEGEATDFDSSDAIGDGVLVEDEERQAGRVSNDIIQAYVNAIGGYKALAVFLAVLITWQSLQVSSDVWLSHWTGNKDPSAVVD
ncbi:hypothetical protein PybrP1_005393, partial [[Pythium] brassicae (nom. inval.)]